MEGITIRTFESPDILPVVDIWNRALKRDPIEVGRFTSWLLGDADYWAGDDSGMFIAEVDGEPVGFIRAIIRRWPNDRIGIEPDNGWIPAMGVDPDYQRKGIGCALLDMAIHYLKNKNRKHIWVCGNTGSAPGYIFPGVDKDVYPGAFELFKKAGFVVDHEPIAMSREVVDFDVDQYHADAWSVGTDIIVEPLPPDRVQDFLEFLAEEFPGDWNIVARHKIKSGRLHEILIARREEEVLGYCQWEAEHFGPFGVAAASRGDRIGAKLFVESVRRIRKADGRSVWFNWADDGAARFYSRFGLKATRHYAILRKDL